MTPKSDPVYDLAEWFCQLREELWPRALPIARIAVMTQVQGYLNSGATVEQIKAVVGPGMRDMAGKGYAEIGSINFFRKGIQNAVARGKRGPRALDLDAQDSRWQARVRGFNKTGFWHPLWGPTPNEAGFLGPRTMATVTGSDWG